MDTTLEQAFLLHNDPELKSSMLNIILTKITADSSENSKISNVVVSKINKLLSTTSTRVKGFELLVQCLGHFNSTIILENYSNFLSFCVSKHQQDNLREINLEVIAALIENASDLGEFNKKFTSEYLLKVLELCVTAQKNGFQMETALKCLILCMEKYSSWFNPHKKTLEAFLLKFIECPHSDVSKLAGTAFLVLQQCGSAGPDGINFVNNYALNIRRLFATVHKLYGLISANQFELNFADSLQNIEPFELEKISLSYDASKILELNALRLKNCVYFVQAFLCKSFPVCKKIVPQELLDIIARGMSLHFCLTSEDSAFISNHYGAILNSIQLELLKLLKLTIRTFRTNLLPFVHSINQILMDGLQRTTNCLCYKTNSHYKEAVYMVLGAWIKLTKNAASTTFQEKLLGVILSDVFPSKKAIVLNLNLKKTKNKKAPQVSPPVKTEATHVLGAKLCTLGLKCLVLMFTHCDITINDSLLSKIYSNIVKTLLDVQIGGATAPFNDLKVQTELYLALVSFLEQDLVKIIPSLQVLTQILLRGAATPKGAEKVVETCERGLFAIERLAQPINTAFYDNLNAVLNDLEGVSIEGPSFEMDALVNDNDTDFEPPNCVILSQTIIPSEDIELPLENSDSELNSTLKTCNSDMSVPSVSFSEETLKDMANNEKIQQNIEHIESTKMDLQLGEPTPKRLKKDEGVLEKRDPIEKGLNKMFKSEATLEDADSLSEDLLETFVDEINDF